MRLFGLDISVRRRARVLKPGSAGWAAVLAAAAGRSHAGATLSGGVLERLISGLTPEQMAGYLDEFYAGNFRNMAMLWEVIERGDPVCAPVAAKRKDKVDAEVSGWRVEPVNETAAAKRQADWLRGFMAGDVRARAAAEPQRCGGVSMASRFMLDAVGKRWSCLQMTWGKGPKLLLEHLPLWHVVQVDGVLHYVPDLARAGGLLPMRPEEWVVCSRSRAVMEAAALQVLFRRLPEQQMVRILEKFGISNVYGETNAQPGSEAWDALQEAVWAYQSDMPVVVSSGTKLNTIQTDFEAARLHHPHMERCDRIITVNWLGGSLGTFAASGTGTLAGGAQADDLDDIVRSDCAWESEVWNTQIVPHALQRRYGRGTRVLAKVVIEKPDAQDDGSDLEVITELTDRGAPVPVEFAMDRFGIPMPSEGEPVLLSAAAQAAAAQVGPLAAPGGGAAGEDADAAAAAAREPLNGAPVQALTDLIAEVATGRLPRENALAIMEAAFGLEPEQAERMMGKVGRMFFVEDDERPHSARSHVRRGPGRDRRADLDGLAATGLQAFGAAYAAMMQTAIAAINPAAPSAEDLEGWRPDEDAFDRAAAVAGQLVFAAAMMGFEPHRDGLATGRISERPHARSHAAMGYEALPFDAAMEFWSRKELVADFADLERLQMTWDEARVRGFRIAGVTADTALQMAHEQIGRAAAGEISGTELVSRLRERLSLNARHAEIVARTNIQSAYQWGHWQQLAAVAADLGWMALEVVLDDDTSDICEPLAQKAYPHDSPVWQEYYPPNHYLCRTTVIALDLDEVREFGYETGAAVPPRHPDTGVAFHAQHGFEGNIGQVSLAEQPGMDIESGEIEALTADSIEMALGDRVDHPGVHYGDWQAKGFESARDWTGLPTGPAQVSPEAARARLEAGEEIITPHGETVTFGSAILRHWEQETGKIAADIEGRLMHLDWAVATVRAPRELWAQDTQDVYVQAFTRSSGAFRGCMVAVTRETGEARTYFVRSVGGLDKCRKGRSVDRFPAGEG